MMYCPDIYIHICISTRKKNLLSFEMWCNIWRVLLSDGVIGPFIESETRVRFQSVTGYVHVSWDHTRKYSNKCLE